MNSPTHSNLPVETCQRETPQSSAQFSRFQGQHCSRWARGGQTVNRPLELDHLLWGPTHAAVGQGTMVAHRQVQQTTWGIIFALIFLPPWPKYQSPPRHEAAKRATEAYKPRIFGSPCTLSDLGCVTGVYNSTINFTLPWGRGYLFKHLQHPDSYMHGCWSEPGIMTRHILLLYLIYVQRGDNFIYLFFFEHWNAADN